MRARTPVPILIAAITLAVAARLAIPARAGPLAGAAAPDRPGPADLMPDPAVPAFRFPSIDGGWLDTADWRGRPVLVVNTASLCAFTPQLDGLQALHETYAQRGLVVLAVPSDDFNQELATGAEVAEFCELTFGLTLPMTDILPVRGAGAHPFYRWLAEAHGIRPGWNFTKVLIGPDGQPLQAWAPNVAPASAAIRRAIEAVLPG
jgi:glutathione peroxidase